MARKETYNAANDGFKSYGVRVKLTCGCTFPSRTRPMNAKTTYPCRSGVGHGYNVGWVSWTEGDQSGENGG